jgi:EAL domain-containing protein (putative c-di-GMP-specific phosphodiesterase class I)
VGVEALIRWNEPESGIVPPSRFIPILEETGMILDVGRWALAEAARVHRKWKAAGLNSGRIAVNVSALQLRQKDFVTIVEETTAPVDGEIGIDIEITETMLMQDITHSLSVLGAIRKLGVMIAIDDFGTGYSSLSYLARLPIDYLKIDRSFISKIADRSDDLEIASAVISMANSLSLKTIAEGVESQEQADLLKALGCHQMQGYSAAQEVEVATGVCLKDMLVVQPGVTALRQMRRPEPLAPLRQVGLGNHQVETPIPDRQADAVAAFHQRQRPA